VTSPPGQSAPDHAAGFRRFRYEDLLAYGSAVLQRVGVPDGDARQVEE